VLGILTKHGLAVLHCEVEMKLNIETCDLLYVSELWGNLHGIYLISWADLCSWGKEPSCLPPSHVP